MVGLPSAPANGASAVSKYYEVAQNGTNRHNPVMRRQEFEREQVAVLRERLVEAPERVQAVFGPRRTGKTTIIRQALGRCGLPSGLVALGRMGSTAHRDRAPDLPDLPGAPFAPLVVRDANWLAEIWQWAREQAENDPRGFVLALDEIQGVPHWSRTVKGLWDADRFRDCPLRVVISGSSPLMMQHGSGGSLMGRLDMIETGPWSFGEMKAAFGVDLDRFLFFGGYPGARPDEANPRSWRACIRRSVVDASLERDLIARARIDRPALLTRLFEFSAGLSGQILSYNKMLGQLADKSNTTTLARYLDLLERIGLVAGLEQYAGPFSMRPSSPKLNVLDTSLMTFDSGRSFEEARADRTFWGRLAASAVGAHLLNTREIGERVRYWREGALEVDFVVERGPKLAVIEVTIGRRGPRHRGLAAFRERYPHASEVLVGPDGESLEDFLSVPAGYWVESDR